jgi:hypothetical protein
MLLVATIVMSAHAPESVWLNERLRAHRAARAGSHSHQSTIDNERFSRHEVRVLAREEQDGADDIARLCDSLDGLKFCHSLLVLPGARKGSRGGRRQRRLYRDPGRATIGLCTG